MSSWQVLDSRGNVARSRALEVRAAGRRMLSAYTGADSGRIFGRWGVHRGSADAVLGPDRMTLVYRTRERVRNDPMLRGCVNTLVKNVIGTGIRASSRLDEDRLGLGDDEAREKENEIDGVWKRWIRESDFSGNEARYMNYYEMQGLLYRDEVESGENFEFPRYERRPGYDFSFCLQLAETDRVCTPQELGGPMARTARTFDGYEVREGVEIGRRGEVRAIWVCDRHPGDQYIFGDRVLNWRRIPAVNGMGKANFWHTFQWVRKEQSRGEPGLAACLSGSRQLGDYIGHELTRAEMAAMFGLLLLQQNPFDTGEDLADADKLGSTAEKAKAQMELYAGMVQEVGPGFSVQTVNPNLPGDNFDSFVERVATLLGSPLDLTRELMLNTFDKSNFSNTRLSLEESRRGFRMRQRRFMAKHIEPARERVIEEAWLRGWLVLPGFEDPELRRVWLGCEMYAPPWPYMEPVKDVQAINLRISTGVSTLEEECGGQGKDWRRVLRQQAKEEELRRSLGLKESGQQSAISYQPSAVSDQEEEEDLGTEEKRRERDES